jgi:hypothetical protein
MMLLAVISLIICEACAYASGIVEKNEEHKKSPSVLWRSTPQQRGHYTGWQTRPPANLKTNVGKITTPYPLAVWKVQALTLRLNITFRGVTVEVAVPKSTALSIVSPNKAVTGSSTEATAFAEFLIGYENIRHSTVVRHCLALGWRSWEVLCPLSLRIARRWHGMAKSERASENSFVQYSYLLLVLEHLWELEYSIWLLAMIVVSVICGVCLLR